MVPSLNVMKDGTWERLFDVTFDEMEILMNHNILSGVGAQHPDEVSMTRGDNETLDNEMRDMYAIGKIDDQIKMDIMLIIYRLRAWTEEGDVFLW